MFKSAFKITCTECHGPELNADETVVSMSKVLVFRKDVVKICAFSPPLNCWGIVVLLFVFSCQMFSTVNNFHQVLLP